MPMHAEHQEDLLDSAIEESFPASDPVSVFVQVKQKPLPWERAAGGENEGNGIPWNKVALLVPVAVGLVGQGVRFWYTRREAALRLRKQQNLAAVAAVGAVLGGVVALRARLGKRAVRGPDTLEDHPLFV